MRRVLLAMMGIPHAIASSKTFRQPSRFGPRMTMAVLVSGSENDRLTNQTQTQFGAWRPI